jgi:acyl carrier protein
MPETNTPSDKLGELLRGFPESTIQACAEFQRTRGDEAFERAFAGIIEHHLTKPAAEPVTRLPGSTTLVADLGLDSLTMVEMAFLFEDLFAAKLPHDEFVKVGTLDDLRRLLRAQMSGPSPA